MRALKSSILAVGLVCLSGCGTSAPLAPIGLDKQPANSPEAVASLLATGDHTPAAEPAPLDAVSDPVAARPAHTSTFATPWVLSDFNLPAGIKSMSVSDRDELVRTALSATRIVLFVRGDRAVPSHSNWARLVRRGVEIKLFLVAQGIASEKVRIFVKSAGGFVADNVTADGRARNRRVEIHFSEGDHGQSI